MTHEHPEAAEYAAAAPALEQAAAAVPPGPWIAIDKLIDAYLERFELAGDSGDYPPDDFERALIRDAIDGLFTDAFQDAVADARRQQRERREQRGECQACGCLKPEHYRSCHEDPSKVIS